MEDPTHILHVLSEPILLSRKLLPVLNRGPIGFYSWLQQLSIEPLLAMLQEE